MPRAYVRKDWLSPEELEKHEAELLERRRARDRSRNKTEKRQAYEKARSPAKAKAQYAKMTTEAKEDLKKRSREWYHSSPDKKQKVLDRNLMTGFGITRKEYDILFKAQGGVCAICSKSPDKKKKLHVDHSHALGNVKAAVRGLLCNYCNASLIAALEHPLLKKALAYLANPPARAVLGTAVEATHDDVYDGDRP